MADVKPHLHEPKAGDPNHCDHCSQHFAEMIHAPAAALRDKPHEFVTVDNKFGCGLCDGHADAPIHDDRVVAMQQIVSEVAAAKFREAGFDATPRVDERRQNMVAERVSASPAPVPVPKMAFDPADGYFPRGFMMLHGLMPSASEGIVAVDPAVPEGMVEIARVQDSTVIHVGDGSFAPKCPKSDCKLIHAHLHTKAEMEADLQLTLKTTECPECHEQIPDRDILLHLREVEAVDQRDIDEMADMLGIDRLPLIQSEVEATREDAERWVETCEHPNGFGPMGCACGASAPEHDDADDVRPPREPEPVVMRCPVLAKCAEEKFTRDDDLVEHMRTVHNFTDSMMGPFVDSPWMSNESRDEWKNRTFVQRLGDRDLLIERGLAPDRFLKMRESMDLGMVRNGVTTEIHRCDMSDEPHPRHLWQPGKNTEWFTCIGEPIRRESSDVSKRKFTPDGEPGVCSSCWSLAERAVDDSGIWWHVGVAPCRQKGAAFRPAGSVQVAEDLSEMIQAQQPQRSLIPEALSGAMRKREEEVTEAVENFLDPEALFDENAQLREELTAWWLSIAAAEAEQVVPKAVEYGSNSLMQLGRKMAQLQGRTTIDDAEALELGCWVNLLQKVERWTDSVMRGERPSDDTLHDIGVYCRMAQRIRARGSWPGV